MTGRVAMLVMNRLLHSTFLRTSRRRKRGLANQKIRMLLQKGWNYHMNFGALILLLLSLPMLGLLQPPLT